MIKDKQLIASQRLKNMLTLDKSIEPNKIANILKSELIQLLSNYIDIEDNVIQMDISLNDKGGYSISFNLNANRLKLIQYII